MFLAKNVKTGIIEYISKNDPRVLSGEYVGKNAGKKYVHNDKLQQKKLINGDEYEQFLIDNPDWQPGFKNYKDKSTKNFIIIHKNDIETKIEKDKLQEYLDNGWILGRSQKIKDKLKITNSGFILINKENNIKRIQEDELQDYLGNGWTRGTGLSGKFIWVNKNNINEKIQKVELQKYLNIGWKKGKYFEKPMLSSTKGKIAINNEKQNKFVVKDNLQEYLDDGWFLGLKIKKETI
jgi:hypothetical protein